VAQCLHEGETRAVLLRKKGPVRRCAGQSVISGIFTRRDNWGALKAGERYIGGALYPEKTYIALTGFAQGT